MEKVRILVLVVSLPSNLKFAAIHSIMRQSVPVEMIVLLTKKSNRGPTLIERTPDVTNQGLESIRLEDFDYILRMDGDTLLGQNFIKNNLADNPDAVGVGFAMLIKVTPFMQLMKGRFYEECDDTYLGIKFKMFGKNVHTYLEKPVHIGKHKGIDVPYAVDRGRMLYRMGWTPLHVFQSIFENLPESLRNIFMFAAYLANFLLLRPEKMDIASWVRSYQVRRETHPFARAP